MTFDLSELVGVMGFLTTVLGISGTIIWNLWKRILQNTRELSEFKLTVAKEYTSYKQLQDLEHKLLASEAKLMHSIDNLTSRIDRMLTRIEK